MTERAAWAMPAVEVCRPVEEVDPLWLKSLAWSADKQQFGHDIQWYDADRLQVTLLSSFELSRLALSNGITLSESTADALDDALYRGLPPSAADKVPLPVRQFVQRPLFPDTRPSMQCLTISGIPPVVAGERKLLQEMVVRRLGVVEHGGYWAPPEACEVRLAEGSSKSIAALRNFMAERAMLFVPSSLKLGKVIVESV